MYGRATMAEIIESTVRDTNNQIVSERGFKLAADPKVTLPEEKDEVEKLIEGKSDLAYTVAVEIVPPITLGNFKDIKIEKPVADVADSEVDEGLTRIAGEDGRFAARPGGGGAGRGGRGGGAGGGAGGGGAGEGGA